MTPEKNWQGLVIHANQINNVVSRVAKGVIWADDRIKTLEEDMKKLEEKYDRTVRALSQ